MPRAAADFEGLLRAFTSAGVSYVVVGGVSAAMQGVPAVTFALDLVLEPEVSSLDRAHGVLEGLNARSREPLGEAVAPRRDELGSESPLVLLTDLGPLNLIGRVATGWNFVELARRSRSVRVDHGLELAILDLAALVELKEHLGREKDAAQLPLYRMTLEERSRRG